LLKLWERIFLMFRTIVKRVAIGAALVLVFVVFGFGLACMGLLVWEIMRA